MLARGQVDDGVIRRHDEKTVSAELKGLGDVAPLESKESLEIKRKFIVWKKNFQSFTTNLSIFVPVT